jgi:hypothetical protein
MFLLGFGCALDRDSLTGGEPGGASSTEQNPVAVGSNAGAGGVASAPEAAGSSSVAAEGGGSAEGGASASGGAAAGSTANAPCVYYDDADDDGYGDTSKPANGCTVPSGHSAKDGDCNDKDARVYPGAPELCDAVDNDCSQATPDKCAAFCVSNLFTSHSYMGCREEKTYAEAEALCSAQKMQLVRIESAEENTHVLSLVGTMRFGWVGGKDAATEGSWQFPDNVVFYDSGFAKNGLYINWSENEPSDWTGTENCLGMMPQGKWNDFACDLKSGFVCERY